MKLNKIADLYAINQIERDRLMEVLESVGFITATQSDIGVVIMEEINAEESAGEVE